MRNYSFKWGKLLFVRWIVISWFFQGVHVYDKTEKSYRVLIEIIPIAILYIFYIVDLIDLYYIGGIILLLHTVFWLFDSHWLVGFREVFIKFKGKGINSIIEYSEYVQSELKNNTHVQFIGIYGSLCRKMYHDRSDLDIRIIQTKPYSFRLFLIVQKLRFIGIWIYRIPLDLKLVDSLDYLITEMRADEYPIVLMNKDIDYYEETIDFEYFKDNRKKFLKNA